MFKLGDKFQVLKGCVGEHRIIAYIHGEDSFALEWVHTDGKAEPAYQLVNTKWITDALQAGIWKQVLSCDCGGTKARTSHSHWCSLNNGGNSRSAL